MALFNSKDFLFMAGMSSESDVSKQLFFSLIKQYRRAKQIFFKSPIIPPPREKHS